MFADCFLPITLFLGRKGKLFAALPIKRWRILPRRLTHARSKVEPTSGEAARKTLAKNALVYMLSNLPNGPSPFH